MRGLFGWGMATLLALTVSHAGALTLKATYGGDVHFAHQAVAVGQYHPKLDELACRAAVPNLEVAIVVGHADSTEYGAKAVSARRADAVRARLIRLGVDPKRVYAESKGSTQPAGTTVASNRRVEVEIVVSRLESARRLCEPGWDQSLLELSVPASAALARSLIREGLMAPHAPLAAAIVARRMDHLDAFLKGPHRIPLVRSEGSALLRQAVLRGGPSYVEKVLAWGVYSPELKQGLPLLWLVCESDRKQWPAEQELQMARQLLAWGVKADLMRGGEAREETALQCAASKGALQLVELLLTHGADPNQPAQRPPVVMAGPSPAVVKRLVASGADSHARLSGKVGLAHTYRAETPADVAWLAGLGLDLREKLGGTGETPLQGALYSAGPDVLDALVTHGARLEDLPSHKAWWPLQNVAGSVWLLDRGFMPRSPGSLAFDAAYQGDRMVPLFRALHRRGVDLGDAEMQRWAVARRAVEGFAPDLLDWLLSHGAVPRGEAATRLRVFAQEMPLRRRPEEMYPSAEVVEAFNTETILRDRQERKDRMVQLLRAYE